MKKIQLNIDYAAITKEKEQLESVAKQLESIHNQLEVLTDGAVTDFDLEAFKAYVVEKSGFAFSDASVALLQLEEALVLIDKGNALKTAKTELYLSKRGYKYTITKKAGDLITENHTMYLDEKLNKDYEILDQIATLANQLSDGRMMSSINVNAANGQVDLIAGRLVGMKNLVK